MTYADYPDAGRYRAFCRRIPDIPSTRSVICSWHSARNPQRPLAKIAPDQPAALNTQVDERPDQRLGVDRRFPRRHPDSTFPSRAPPLPNTPATSHVHVNGTRITFANSLLQSQVTDSLNVSRALDDLKILLTYIAKRIVVVRIVAADSGNMVKLPRTCSAAPHFCELVDIRKAGRPVDTARRNRSPFYVQHVKLIRQTLRMKRNERNDYGDTGGMVSTEPR